MSTYISIAVSMYSSMDMAWEPWDTSAMWHAELNGFKSDARVAAEIFPKWKKQAREEVDREGTTQSALANRHWAPCSVELEFAQWLHHESSLTVRVPEDGDSRPWHGVRRSRLSPHDAARARHTPH